VSDFISRLVVRGAGLALPATLHPPPAPPSVPDLSTRIPSESGEAASRIDAGTSPSRQEVESRVSSEPSEVFFPNRSPASQLPSNSDMEPVKIDDPVTFEPIDKPHAGTPPEASSPPASANGNSSILPLSSNAGPTVSPQIMPVIPAEAFALTEKQPDQSSESQSKSGKTDLPAREAFPSEGPAPVPAQSIITEWPTRRDADLLSKAEDPIAAASKQEFNAQSESSFAAVYPSGQSSGDIRRRSPSQPVSSLPLQNQAFGFSPLNPVPAGSSFAESTRNNETVIPPIRMKDVVILPASAGKPPAAFPAPAENAALEEPVPVHIHIGTVEVRAPAPPQTAAPAPPPARGFADYDRIRNYENWEME
jgi:hypothetical protein